MLLSPWISLTRRALATWVRRTNGRRGLASVYANKVVETSWRRTSWLSRGCVAILMLCVGAFCLSSSAEANCFWLDEAGSWFNAEHWTGADCSGVPTAGDSVEIDGEDADVRIEGDTAEAATVTVSAGRLTLGKDGTLSVDGGGGSMILGEHDGLQATPGWGVLVIGAAAGEEAVDPGVVNASEIEMGRGDGGDGTKASGLIVFNHTNNTSAGYIFRPNLTGVGSIQQEGGTTVLGGANSFTGTVIVNGGALRAGGEDSFVQGGTYVVNGGSLQLNGFDLTMSSLSGDGGEVLLGNVGAGLDQVTLTIDQDIDTTFGGKITGPDSLFRYGEITLIKDGAGALTLTGENELNNLYNYAEVRVDGGELRVADGGKLRASSLTVGSENENATFRVVGHGSEWSTGSGGWVDVGSVGGQAVISVEDGATFAISGSATISHKTDSEASVVVRGGSTWKHLGGGLYVGYKGDGALSISEGSEAISSRSEIGSEQGSRGRVTVDGAGSKWSAQDHMFIGNEGEGHLSITNGGELVVANSFGARQNGIIGYSQGAVGNALITGDGSMWRVGDLTVGYGGLGELTVTDGGAVESSSAVIGHQETAQGSALVSGADAVWTATDLVIGAAGEGTLTLAEGGRLASTWIKLADSAGSFGVLNIGGGGAPGEFTRASEITFGEGDGRLVFDHTGTQYEFGSMVTAPTLVSAQPGKGRIEHVGGTTHLLSDGTSFSGVTVVSGGTLFVDNVLGGTVTVKDGGTLAGFWGSVGSTVVEDGGVLAPGNAAGAGALIVDGDLTLTSGGALHFTVGRPGTWEDPLDGVSGRLIVTGDVTLDGTLNVAQSGRPDQDGTMGLGYYRLMTYDGKLTDNGLEFGSFPDVDGGAPVLITSDGRVDLFIASVGDDTLQHWQGGDGVWNATDATWLNDEGELPVNWAGNHAVFKNEPGGFEGGVIDVEGTQSFKGLQFVDEGFRLQGDGELMTDNAGSEIRVLADEAEIATKIAGGKIIKTEAGTLILSGDNDYAGGTIIAGGTVQVSKDANLGDASGGLVLRGGVLRATSSFVSERDVSLELLGGVFDVEQLGADPAPRLELSGRITGDGALRKTGSGVLVLSNSDNDYSGGTFIEGGTIDVSETGALGTGAVTVDGGGSRLRFSGSAHAGNAHIASRNGGTVEFVDDATAEEATIVIDSNGTVDVAGTRTGASIGSLSGTGEVMLGAKTLTVGNLGRDDTFDGVLIDDGLGGGLIKIGSGTLTLSGDQSYTGATEVRGGHLVVNGSITSSSHITVYDGASIGGAGTLGSTRMAAGSTLSAGNSIGTLVIDGDLIVEEGARFVVEVNPDGDESDLVQVTGTAVINGGSVLHIGADGDYDVLSTYRILKADDGLVGAFGDVSSDFAFLTPVILYDYDDFAIDLHLARNDVKFAALASTFNQRSTAGGVESLANGHDVYDAILTLAADEALIGRVFDSLSGEIHASLKTALMADSRLVREAIAGRTRQLTAARQGPVQGALPESSERVRDWGHWLREQGTIDTDGNAAAMARETSGFLVGSDANVIDDWSIGWVLGHSRSTYEVAERSSTASGDAFYVGGYGGTTWAATSFGAGVAVSGHDLRTERSVTAAGLDELVSASYDGQMWQVFAELRHRLRAGRLVLEPFANAAYIGFRTDSFTEDGGAASLSVDRHAMATTMASVGVRLQSIIGGGKAAIRGALGFAGALGNTAPRTMHAFQDGEKFAVAGVPGALGLGIGFVDLGLEFNLGSNMTLSAVYSGQIGSGAQHHAINLAIGRAF